MRIGIGYDIHRTCAGDHIWLGGVKVTAPFSLEGHSDADVLLHAITDAVLGALAQEDIGHHFPPSDEKNRKRKSSDFLKFAIERMREAKYKIANVDCNVICERPRIAPLRDKLRTSLATLLQIDLSQVSVKGKTNERADTVGQEGAVICQAVVLLVSHENR